MKLYKYKPNNKYSVDFFRKDNKPLQQNDIIRFSNIIDGFIYILLSENTVPKIPPQINTFSYVSTIDKNTQLKLIESNSTIKNEYNINEYNALKKYNLLLHDDVWKEAKNIKHNILKKGIKTKIKEKIDITIQTRDYTDISNIIFLFNLSKHYMDTNQNIIMNIKDDTNVIHELNPKEMYELCVYVFDEYTKIVQKSWEHKKKIDNMKISDLQVYDVNSIW